MSNDNTFSYLDSYCERAGEAGLWAEPVNALTNLAFLIGAYAIYRIWRRMPDTTLRNSWDIVLLVATLAMIGLGSGAWHLFADGRTLLLDVIPILVFMNIYLAAAAVRLMGLRWRGAVAMLAAFHAMNYASETYLPRDVLNGTVMYLPAFIMLLVLNLSLWLRHSPQRGRVGGATLLFCLSLSARTLDMAICPSFPLGSHFLWHLCNAGVLTMLLWALVGTVAKKH